MSYNPHHFRHLFPKGLFGHPNQNFTNFKESQYLFAKNQSPQTFTSSDIAPGLVIKTGHLNNGSGFSNYLVFDIDTNLRQPSVYYSPQAIYPIQAFKKNSQALLMTNLGYFFLPTNPKLDPITPPRIKVGNLVVYHGRFISLPIADRSTFIVYSDHSIAAKFIRARGTLTLNQHSLTWSGSKTNHHTQAKIYTSNNVEVLEYHDPIIGPARRVNQRFIQAKPYHHFVCCTNVRGKFKVATVTTDPQTAHTYDLVIEVPHTVTANPGDLVIMHLADLSLSTITSATSIGPTLLANAKLRNNQVVKEGLHSDFFLSSVPHQENVPLARGCLVIHDPHHFSVIMIDAIPQAGDIYPGVTPGQVYTFAHKLYPNAQTIVSTDPANTLKAVYKQAGQIKVFGNLHYLGFKVLTGGRIKFWPNGYNGRKIHTMLMIK